MRSVLIIGSSGMLGSTVTRYLSSGKYRIAEANRTGFPVNAGNECHKLDINNLSNQNLEYYKLPQIVLLVELKENIQN